MESKIRGMIHSCAKIMANQQDALVVAAVVQAHLGYASLGSGDLKFQVTFR